MKSARRALRLVALVRLVAVVVEQAARRPVSFCGASQRLEQWSEAMFWSGTRMCPLSSMCATSST